MPPPMAPVTSGRACRRPDMSPRILKFLASVMVCAMALFLAMLTYGAIMSAFHPRGTVMFLPLVAVVWCIWGMAAAIVWGP